MAPTPRTRSGSPTSRSPPRGSPAHRLAETSDRAEGYPRRRRGTGGTPLCRPMTDRHRRVVPGGGEPNIGNERMFLRYGRGCSTRRASVFFRRCNPLRPLRSPRETAPKKALGSLAPPAPDGRARYVAVDRAVIEGTGAP